MFPSVDEVREYAANGQFKRVPVCEELLSDRFTPVEVMRTLRSASCHCFLLESAEQGRSWGRYSFLGCNPTMELTCTNGKLRITEGAEGEGGRVTEREVEHPGDAIREVLARYASPQVPGMPPLSGGLVGYFSYDYIKYAEPRLRENQLADRDFRDVDLMLFDEVIVFDNLEQKLKITAGVHLDDPAGIDAAYEAARGRIERLVSLIEGNTRAYFPPLRLTEPLTPRFSQAEYTQMVDAAKHYIHEGDIFQVVLSDPITAPAEGSLFDVYRTLRCTNPSPYMVFMTSDDVELAAASPETLAKLENGKLFTYPLAGTRPRGKTHEEDAELERGLLADEKELAEHNMLVDLGRNDIGRVAALGSVKVESYHNVLRFSHVMHIGSTVTGQIADDHDAVDVIDSILPAGTLSGAPKLRACQIISDLEGSKRGIYGGAIGYLDFSGNLDTCIGIRLAYKKNGEVCVQSGAGIVADSVPAKEFMECTNKARAVVEAVRAAEGGLA